MMRAMLLEFPEDPTVWDLSRQYMLGGSLLVAPVFDQQKHRIYLPQGSWIDLETGACLSGGWITYPRQIDVIPLFLRQNAVIPMLKTAPDHIADENFAGLELVIHIADQLDQPYYDDGVEGRVTASLEEGTLTIRLEDVPADRFRIYSPRPVRRVFVNGVERPLRTGDGCVLA